MALTKEAVEALAKAANMTFDDLDAAIKAEDEKTIEVKTTKAYTEESWKTFEANFKKENYEEGKTAGSEMVIKELKKSAELEFEGKKQEDFLKNYKSKILSDAKINPDKRVTELQEDLRVMREETIPNITREKETLAGQISKIRMEKEIIKHIPKKLPEGMTQDDALMIVQNNLEFNVVDGKEQVKKNGSVLKTSDTRENIGFQSAISDFATERKWRAGDGGRGGGDETPPAGVLDDHKKARTMSEVEAIAEKKGISMLGEEGKAMVADAAKAAKEAKEEFKYEE